MRGTEARLDASFEHARSEPIIDRILEEVGFTHLPRHTCAKLWGDSLVPIEASGSIRPAPSHSAQFQYDYAAGVVCLLPPLRPFGIDQAIDGVGFRRSATLPLLPSQVTFMALKCNSVRRYACEEKICGALSAA